MPSFSFIPLMVSEEKIFNIFLENLPFVWPPQQFKISDLDKRYMKRGGLLNKHIKDISNISNETAETVIFGFSHYKSMGL